MMVEIDIAIEKSGEDSTYQGNGRLCFEDTDGDKDTLKAFIMDSDTGESTEFVITTDDLRRALRVFE